MMKKFINRLLSIIVVSTAIILIIRRIMVHGTDLKNALPSKGVNVLKDMGLPDDDIASTNDYISSSMKKQTRRQGPRNISYGAYTTRSSRIPPKGLDIADD